MAERKGDILVINPNSNPAVTTGMDQALDAFRFAEGPSIRCATLAEGPLGIETQRDVESVTLPLRRLVEADNAAEVVALSKLSALRMPAAETCSMWQCGSIPPGSTSLPVASISRAPAGRPRPIAATLSPLIATSAANAPRPVATVPPRMTNW